MVLRRNFLQTAKLYYPSPETRINGLLDLQNICFVLFWFWVSCCWCSFVHLTPNITTHFTFSSYFLTSFIHSFEQRCDYFKVLYKWRWIGHFDILCMDVSDYLVVVGEGVGMNSHKGEWIMDPLKSVFGCLAEHCLIEPSLLMLCVQVYLRTFKRYNFSIYILYFGFIPT